MLTAGWVLDCPESLAIFPGLGGILFVFNIILLIRLTAYKYSIPRVIFIA